MKKKSITNRLAEIGLVLFIFVLLIGILMPTLSSVRKAGVIKSMEYYEGSSMPASARITEPDKVSRSMVVPNPDKEETIPSAMVGKFDAEINLTPKLSVGTTTPESIYVAEFKSTIEAKSPEKGQKKCLIELPLPPQVISLADVNVTVNGVPSEDFSLGRNCLMWKGMLDDEKTSEISVTYSATGKGIYTLEKPAGKIIQSFKTRLIANKSNIQMLQLSLQPNSLQQSSNSTIYTWEYKRLVAAQPIAIDVLGIAGIDRLERLTWLGPLSVFVFGILISLAALAYEPEKLNGWVIVLVVGCFAGAYPMMYFLQDFVTLPAAIGIASAVALIIVGWRIISVCGLHHGIFGGLILPAAMLLLTLATALAPKQAEQGVLLTVMAIFAFVVTMVLLPKVQAKLIEQKIEESDSGINKKPHNADNLNPS